MQEHAKGPAAEARELEELAQIYVKRGLPYALAKQVAKELSRVDPVRAHARDELGIDMDDYSNPTQAAAASAVAFASGGAIPLLAGSFIADFWYRLISVIISTSLALALFGAVGARLGGAPIPRAAARVLVGGMLAMALTFAILRAFGTAGI
jgi:VIT1/CCC1 family predicted Fe2+/Mn2+ transporter